MSTQNDLNTYLAATIVKACTEKDPKLVDVGAGPYQEASARLTRNEEHEVCLDAKNEGGAIHFRYGWWLGDPAIAFAGWQELATDYAHVCLAHLLPGKTTRTVTVLYEELTPFLPAR